jgi:hypothetical protein
MRSLAGRAFFRIPGFLPGGHPSGDHAEIGKSMLLEYAGRQTGTVNGVTKNRYQLFGFHLLIAGTAVRGGNMHLLFCKGTALSCALIG